MDRSSDLATTLLLDGARKDADQNQTRAFGERVVRVQTLELWDAALVVTTISG